MANEGRYGTLTDIPRSVDLLYDAETCHTDTYQGFDPLFLHLHCCKSSTIEEGYMNGCLVIEIVVDFMFALYQTTSDDKWWQSTDKDPNMAAVSKISPHVISPLNTH